MKIVTLAIVFLGSYAMANTSMSWEEIQADPRLGGGFPTVSAGLTLDQMCMLPDGETLESIEPVTVCTKKVLRGRRGFQCVNESSRYIQASNTIYEQHPIADRGYTRKAVKTSYSEKYDIVNVYKIYRGGNKVRVGKKPYSIPSCLN